MNGYGGCGGGGRWKMKWYEICEMAGRWRKDREKKKRVSGQMGDTDVITVDKGCSGQRRMQLMKKITNHAVSATTLATPLYSASALEQERVC
ncbi:hypothetical protein Tco_1553949 [Tanacetum coccineum]